MRRGFVFVCFVIYFLVTTVPIVKAEFREEIVELTELVSRINVYDSCFISAALFYGVSYELLVAIAKVESNLNPRALGRNNNRSYDIGIMQINSSWLPYLKKYGVRIEHLWDPCYNIHIGAMVLRNCINIHGNSWRAVDCYNKGSRRAKNSSKYVWNVYRTLTKITEKQRIITSLNQSYQSTVLLD